jgi:2-dehydropantoate 2-reductase
MAGSFEPKIAVVGAGAMGCLFGGLLSEGGLDVTLIDVRQDQVDAINRDGLKIVGYGGNRSIHVPATTDPGTVGVADVVLVHTKAYDTVAAIEGARPVIGDETVLISFQNGLGNEETIAGIVGEQKVLGGLTAQGAVPEGLGVVRNYSDLPSYVGELFGGELFGGERFGGDGAVTDRVQRIADAFSAAGLDTHASADIRRDIWKKLLGNIGLSAASGATDLSSAEMAAIPELRATIDRAVEEAAAVARADGVDIGDTEKNEVLEKLLSTTAGTGASKSSLNVDLHNRRRTEIDTIYGSVTKIAREHGVATPTLDTLIGIVKGLERHYL